MAGLLSLFAGANSYDLFSADDGHLKRCQPLFYLRLGGLSLSLVRRGGIRLGVVLNRSS